MPTREQVMPTPSTRFSERHGQGILQAGEPGPEGGRRDAGRTRHLAITRQRGRTMARTHEPVAVLGLGAMGHGMAASALRAGIPTIVWNRTTEATRDLAELGAEVAETAAAAARRAAIVVTMVTDADAVLSIARDQGMLAALAPGAIWAQMSTIGVAGTDQVVAMAGAQRPDVMLLDAPVSGSKDPADHGKLTIFASGPDETHARVAPLFDALGQRTIWVGEAGAGTRLKLVNNAWLAFAAEAVAASVALAGRLGLETETVVDALGGGPLVSTWQAAKLRRIAEGEFSAQFALSLALKDVQLALVAAGDNRFAALLGLADEWQQAVDQGLGEQDLTIVTRVLEQQGGTPLEVSDGGGQVGHRGWREGSGVERLDHHVVGAGFQMALDEFTQRHGTVR